MKTIFIKKECVLITIWNETILVNNKLETRVCTETLKCNDIINKIDIINAAFQLKKSLDKRDSFVIVN